MKKALLLLAGVALSAASASADYYLIGGFNGWSLKDSKTKFTEKGDGSWVLDYNGTLTSGFKINDGTWSNDNANFGGSNTLEIGVVYNLSVGGSSGNISISENIENPHIVLNPTAKTLLITGEAKEATYKWGLWGSFAGDWGGVDLEENNGIWEASEVTINNTNANFGIKKMDADSGAQVDWYSATGNGVVDPTGGDYPCKVEGTNFSIPAGVWNFSWNPETLVLTLTPKGEIVITYPETCFVIGNVNSLGWATNNTIALTSAGEGIFTGEAIHIGGELGTSNGYISFCEKTAETADDWNALGIRWGAIENDFAPELGKPVTLQNGTNSYMLESGDYNIIVNFEAMTVTFEIAKAPFVIEDEDIKISTTSQNGNILNGTLEIQTGLLNEDGVAYGEITVELEGATIFYATEPATRAAIDYVEAPNGKIILTGNGTLYLKAVKDGREAEKTIPYTVTFDEILGVDTISVADDATATYFNLQGARIANPENGIFIKVVNGKATKIVK